MFDECVNEYLTQYCQNGIDRERHEALMTLWKARESIEQDAMDRLNSLYLSLDPLAKKYADEAIAGEGQVYDNPLEDIMWYFYNFMQVKDSSVRFLSGDLPWSSALDGKRCFVKRNSKKQTRPRSGWFINGDTPTVLYHPDDIKEFGLELRPKEKYKSIFEMVLVGGWKPD